jgi:predicted component of type VI protein secretion system
VARVLWRDAQGNEGNLELGSKDVLIGRAVECAIRTDDAMVSRNHARLFYQGPGYVLEDLGSANGMFYQENRITRHDFKHGDAVRCGSLWLRFIDAVPQPEAGQPPFGKPAAIGAEMSDPTMGAPPSYQPPSPGAPPFGGGVQQPMQPSARDKGGFKKAVSSDPDEVPRLRRKIEQLKAELRIYRGGGEASRRTESLEAEIERLEEERDHFKRKITELEQQIMVEGGDAKVLKAGEIAQTAGEIVAGLNDVLSNMRINVMAASGEFDQYHDSLPRASFELIREGLRTCTTDVDMAREMLRKLREIAR